MVWFGTRSLGISSQGVGDGANSNDSKTPVFLAYSYSMVPGVWYGLVHGLLVLLPMGVGDGANSNDSKTPVFLAYSYSQKFT
jgi:hypothetical protein